MDFLRVNFAELNSHITKKQFFKDREYRSIRLAVFGLIFNLLYAFYNGALGIAENSFWFTVSCLYYLLLALVRFIVLLSSQNKNVKRESFLIRFSGCMFCILSIVLVVMIYVTLSNRNITKYGEITMITIATYTFTKIIIAIVKQVKYHKQNSSVMTVIQYIGYAETAVALFTMQCSMLVSFGDMNIEKATILNLFTGIAVGLFIFMLGIIMLKLRLENENGKIKNNKG